MCEAKVFLETNNGERRLLMEDVVSITPVAERLELVDLFGEQKSVNASIKEIKLLEHEVLLQTSG